MSSARATSVRRRRTVNSSSDDDDSDDQPLIQRRARNTSKSLAPSHIYPHLPRHESPSEDTGTRKDRPDLISQKTVAGTSTSLLTPLAMEAMSPSQPMPGDRTTLPRTHPARDPAGLDPLNLFPNLPTKSFASCIKHLFAQNENLVPRLATIEDQVKQQNDTIQDLIKQLEEKEVSRAEPDPVQSEHISALTTHITILQSQIIEIQKSHAEHVSAQGICNEELGKRRMTHEARNIHLEKQFTTFEARLDTFSDRQVKDECRLEHLSFRQTESETNVQSNTDDYKRLENHLGDVDTRQANQKDRWTKKFEKLANRIKELEDHQHEFHIAQNKTNEELREHQQELVSVQKKFDDELQRRLRESQTTQQNYIQELEKRWQETGDKQTTCMVLVERLQQEQKCAHEKGTQEIGRWEQQLQSTQEGWQRFEHEIQSTQRKRGEEFTKHLQKIELAQELLSEKLKKHQDEVQSVWKRSVNDYEKRWHDFGATCDRWREDYHRCHQDIASMQEKWRSFECDQSAHKVESAQEKCNLELLERQQQLQIQLETCNRELEKHQAKQEKWNSMSDHRQHELESTREQENTELKDRQLENQSSVEECIKQLTSQQAELESMNVIFTPIKECLDKLIELNVKTKEITPLTQDPVVDTSRGSPKIQAQRSSLPQSPTPFKNLEFTKRDPIPPPLSESNDSSRSTNPPKKTNEEYREEARANSHLQRFNTPGVLSLTNRRQMTPSTPTVSASSNKDTRSGNGNNTRPSSVGSQATTALKQSSTLTLLERTSVSAAVKQVPYADPKRPQSSVGRDMSPSLKKRQPSREIAPPAKRIMASTEVTSPARSGRDGNEDGNMPAKQPKSSSRTTPIVKKGTAVPVSKAKVTNNSPINRVSKGTSGSSIKSNVPGHSLVVAITPTNASTNDEEQVKKPSGPVVETTEKSAKSPS